MNTANSTQELQFAISNREKQIETISAILKGPLPSYERRWHVADRKELREELACLKNELTELTKTAGVS